MREITDIKEIQQISYGILKYVDQICKENNIKYFLAGGTLLGAVRHKGFIPWDDDIDILMPREDYERFLEIMDKTEHKQYKALHYGENFPNYFYPFTKVVDLNTKLNESDYVNHEDLGVFIDVFPADGINIDKKNKILKKYGKIRTLLTLSASKRYSKSRKKKLINNIGKFIVFCLTRVTSWKHWYKKLEQFIKKNSLKDSEFYTLYSGAWGEREIFPKSYMDDVIYLQFKDGKYPAFKNYDGHLTHMYGDYMTPPPKEKQVTHHDFKIYKK